jgi:hypothetical protein
LEHQASGDGEDRFARCAMKRCRFCEQDKIALAKAHVIPRSFFKRVRGEAKYSTELRASEKAVTEKFQQAGHYDCEILCEDCERKFTPYDTHGFSVFTKVFENQNIYRDPHGFECAYLLPNVDFRLLKLFVLSVLWRASVSRLRFYRNVDLGQRHEHKIKSLIASGTIEHADDYQFVCSHQKDHPYPKVILEPLKGRIESEGVNYVKFYLPDVQIVVKVDKRPLPDFFRRIVVTPKPPHYMVLFPYKGSDEAAYFEGMKATIRAANGAANGTPKGKGRS